MRALFLLLLCSPAFACSLDDGPMVQRLVGVSPNGQWLVSWDMSKDTGGFSNSEFATVSRAFCIVAGKKRSLGTIGAAVQKIRVAADPKAEFDATWAQYVTLPLDDPQLAPVVADMRAAVCPQLLPFTPKVCQ